MGDDDDDDDDEKSSQKKSKSKSKSKSSKKKSQSQPLKQNGVEGMGLNLGAMANLPPHVLASMGQMNQQVGASKVNASQPDQYGMLHFNRPNNQGPKDKRMCRPAAAVFTLRCRTRRKTGSEV